MLQATPYLRTGKISEIVDKEIGSNYNDISSVWKVVDTAMACVKYEGKQQPTMNEVCNELSEALRLETSSQTISSAIIGEYYPLNDVSAR